MISGAAGIRQSATARTLWLFFQCVYKAPNLFSFLFRVPTKNVASLKKYQSRKPHDFTRYCQSYKNPETGCQESDSCCSKQNKPKQFDCPKISVNRFHYRVFIGCSKECTFLVQISIQAVILFLSSHHIFHWNLNMQVILCFLKRHRSLRSGKWARRSGRWS